MFYNNSNIFTFKSKHYPNRPVASGNISNYFVNVNVNVDVDVKSVKSVK